MYQLPVGNIEKIRKARRAVKSILSEIGLEDCQNFLKDHKGTSAEKTEENVAFARTDWFDITEDYTRPRKWPYRSRTLCCSICKYSSQSLHNFRSHVSRCHGDEQSACALVPCSLCLFVGHPRAVKRHTIFFHTKGSQQLARDRSAAAHRGNERYQCRRCGFPTSSVFAVKKHIILKHLDVLVERFIGFRFQSPGSSVKIYCCKVCKANTGTLDQMLHHMLVEPTHYNVNVQVQGLIQENKNYSVKAAQNGSSMFLTFPNIVPKPPPSHVYSNKSVVVPTNGQAAGTILTLQQVQGAQNNTTLICAPGNNQTFLPPQASALVQLASAEAKGLLQPGATIALRGALPQGSSVVQLPTMTNVAFAPAQTQKPQQTGLQPGLESNTTAQSVPAPKPAAPSSNAGVPPVNLQGSMMTSQSLLNHLIPTGNKVNGMPTYTFAPLVTAKPSQNSGGPLRPVDQSSNTSAQTKKWITCPLCNEIFPSNIFYMHMEAAHKTKSSSSKCESIAAQASFLRKLPDKTIKCLKCRVLLSDKTVFQHLLHGLSCLSCNMLFFSIRQLIDHMKQHNCSSKSYSEFLRQKYKVFTKNSGGILFPYFDAQTNAPAEVVGEKEVNLLVVSNSLELLYVKLLPNNQLETCPTPAKFSSSTCPFCDEKFHDEQLHIEHLKQKHLVAPTIHAILKTEAFKCIYCSGVYTGKVTQQAVMVHILRCRCSPKQSTKIVAPPPPPLAPPPPPPPPPPPAPAPKQLLQIAPQSGLYFLQVPQGMTVKPALASQRLVTAKPVVQTPPNPAEMESAKRLEAAWKVVMAANKREREEKAALKKKRDQEKQQEKHLEKQLEKQQEKQQPPAEPDVPVEPKVKLVLEPTTVERRGNDERRDFISKYFNRNPYATKSETEELSKRLSLTKSELGAHFSKRRGKCMKSIKRKSPVVLLGFNMAELNKLKHNLVIPEQKPADQGERMEEDGSGREVDQS